MDSKGLSMATGSNSKFLSSEINTIFRGRSDEVSVLPFTFREFCQDRQESVNDLWKEYYTYGGLPALRKMPTAEQKTTYLQRLWKKTYLDDVVERHNVENREALEAIAYAHLSVPLPIRHVLPIRWEVSAKSR